MTQLEANKVPVTGVTDVEGFTAPSAAKSISDPFGVYQPEFHYYLSRLDWTAVLKGKD
jgi:hypothetical protein